ncbi:MAG: DinB family protein [Vicinamibacteraceae bacterium]|nr:DinB family protein [Vicinamibacteraceae bacterium]MCL4846214.1 DinB family protein [Acidobacteriota bacterium]
MDPETRRQLVQQYRDGVQAVLDALDGITDAELDARPGPGQWTAREIVHHLADSEMTSAIRLRLLVAGDRPAIVGYDQDAFARRLFYDRPIDASLLAFRAARETTAELLDRLSEDDWRRSGTHSEIGPYSVTLWLEIYAEHAVKHAGQIRRARASART